MPTDKELLDWLGKRGLGMTRGGFGWGLEYLIGNTLNSIVQGRTRKSPRAAIDAAMKAERTRKKEEGR